MVPIFVITANGVDFPAVLCQSDVDIVKELDTHCKMVPKAEVTYLNNLGIVVMLGSL
jgi:hypothetical protein